MKEEKLQVFLEGVQKYFAQMIIGEELVVGTPYLVENKVPSAKDFTGVISISGKNKGIVYFTAPKELLEIWSAKWPIPLQVMRAVNLAKNLKSPFPSFCAARLMKSCCRAKTVRSLSL